MGDVVQFGKKTGATPEKERWASGEVRCLSCKHEWIGVYKIPSDNLECPECGCHRGTSKNPYSAPEDWAVWTCNCGNKLMHLIVDKVGHEELLCVGCGVSRQE